ncbi:MAG TPA: flagellar biosynthetic protein FliR [Polyangiaceae bacterium]|jgi:flagellar biosynthetic protein FliR
MPIDASSPLLPTLDTLLRAHAGAFSLEVVRIAGMVVVAPLSWTIAPLRVRAALIVLLALAVHGQLSPGLAQASPEQLACGVTGEFLLGAAIGFVVRLVIAGVEFASDQIAPMMGLSAAQMFDPSAHATHTVLSTLFRNLAILLGLVAGLHRIALGGLLHSFRVIPVGTLVHLSQPMPLLFAMTASALESGIRMAIPLIAVLLMTQVALAFISRAAPAIQIFSIGFAVTLATGTLLLVLVLPDIGYQVLSDVSHVGTQIESLLFSAGAAS